MHAESAANKELSHFTPLSIHSDSDINRKRMTSNSRKRRSELAVTLCLLALAMFVAAQTSAAPPSSPQVVNVCDAAFECTSDLQCQNVGDRFGQRWACRESKCAQVECLTDLDCKSPQICVSNRCSAATVVAIGQQCEVMAGYGELLREFQVSS